MSMSKGGMPISGDYFTMGNFACVEGAILAGCRLYAGYPITPSSEIFERASVRFPQVGGNAIEMEDEVASMAALVGGSFAGAKVMTATSGPGFSLMMENIGLAYMMEAPCVVVNVQRAGPSTGVPTLVGQGDMMQAKWGSHGDLEVIAYSPSSVQEFFDLTIQAFNSAERFRTPVFVMADQVVGMMWEKLHIPPADEIEVVDRQVMEPTSLVDKEHPVFDYARDFLPMPVAGRGNRVNVDSLTHDSRGYPSTDHDVSERMVRHLTGKIKDHSKEIWRWEESYLDDAEIAVVSYGSAARSSLAAVKAERAKGVKAGLLRLVTPWPFPDEVVEKLSSRVSGIVVAEVNYGQMVHPVRENSRCPVVGANWAPGSLIEPRAIVDAMQAVVAK
jgi:2-oxoglutarate/2-oxoacid ferredoxin oxidoreductase subunit alpha